jgi:hypothetical protein
MEFMTDNDLVGSYEIMAYVQDKSTESGRPDYPPTPFRVYENFTLNILNVNDAPRARLDQPLSTFVYNTSSVIEFNATRSSDVDIIHGDSLNYTWKKDSEILGYGSLLFKTIDEVGTYNITVNVTDQSGIFSVDWVNIEIEKARVPGEIFEGKDMERTHSDNSTPVVISKTTKVVKLFEGGQYGLDVASVSGTRNGALYKIRIMFTEKLDFLYTEEVIQEPQVELYFLTGEFEESPVEINPQTALDYLFPVPFSNVRYTRLEYDLRGPSATYPPSIVPLDTIRMLDDGMGVEITLTVVEMDDLGIKPDFDLYAVSQMKTTIKDANGQTLEVLSSWDSAGLNTNKPVISDAQQQDDDDNGESDFPLGLVIIIAIILVVFIIIIVLLVLLMKGKGKEEEPPAPAPQQMSVEDEILGEKSEDYPNYPGAQQMYGQTPQQQQPGLPPETQQAGLPPAQMQQGQDMQPSQSPGQVPDQSVQQAAPQQLPQGGQPQQTGQYIPPQ